MEAPRTIRLRDGRSLAFDDIGDPAGMPVVYLHGTPDSRLARHPDEQIATDLGVRLLAVDRPGAGASDLHDTGTLTSMGDDLAQLLDELDVGRAALLGWSAGGLAALAAATVLGDRVAAIALVATLPPVEAYDDSAVLASLGEARRGYIEMAREVAPSELAAEVAPLLVPQPVTPSMALEHVLESAGERGRAELESVPGAAEQLARALEAAVHVGIGGLRHDLALQLERGLDLSLVLAPVRSFHGTEDSISPPEVGAWLAGHLSQGVLDRVADAGHLLLLTRWRGILRALVRDAGNPSIGEPGC